MSCEYGPFDLGTLTLPSTANWTRRKTLIEYCVSAVDESLDSQRKVIQSQDVDPRERRKAQAAMYSDDVKVRRVFLQNF